MSDMDDLTITKLCAEAMGVQVFEMHGRLVLSGTHYIAYDPLHDDAQCMALVKWLQGRGSLHISNLWFTFYPGHDRVGQIEIPLSNGLNAAICLCVAKRQEAKNV